MRNVVVTGGSRGIGLAIASRLWRAGYHPIIVARHPPDPASVEIDAETANTDRSAWGYVQADLSAIESLPALARTIRNEHGAIYGLINNAGIGSSGILSTMQDARIEASIRLNVLSPLVLTKYLVRSMMAANTGRIVNVSSIVATTGYPGLSVYSATKSAMIGFTRSLAREVGALGITVNAVAPGFVDTEMTNELNQRQRGQIINRSALHRMVTVDDIAAAVEFMLSDQAANITGTVMTVDAGSTA